MSVVGDDAGEEILDQLLFVIRCLMIYCNYDIITILSITLLTMMMMILVIAIIMLAITV